MVQRVLLEGDVVRALQDEFPGGIVHLPKLEEADLSIKSRARAGIAAFRVAQGFRRGEAGATEPLTFLLGRRGDRDRLIGTGIQRTGDTSDCTTLAGSVIAFKHADHRHLFHPRITEQAVEPPLHFFQLTGISLFRQFLIELQRA